MKEINAFNVCFIGRTGNGKSSLINSLWNVGFATDPLKSCTKQLISVTLMDNQIPGYEAVRVYDTPGIGEFSSDTIYERYYEHAVSVADCIVLVTTFDRTDAPAQRLLMKLKQYINTNKDVRFVIALNHIDSNIITDSQGQYVPWDEEKNAPSEKCEENIQERVLLLKEKFKDRFLPFDVIPVCAVRNYGINDLKTILYNK